MTRECLVPEIRNDRVARNGTVQSTREGEREKERCTVNSVMRQ